MLLVKPVANIVLISPVVMVGWHSRLLPLQACIRLCWLAASGSAGNTKAWRFSIWMQHYQKWLIGCLAGRKSLSFYQGLLSWVLAKTFEPSASDSEERLINQLNIILVNCASYLIHVCCFKTNAQIFVQLTSSFQFDEEIHSISHSLYTIFLCRCGEADDLMCVVLLMINYSPSAAAVVAASEQPTNVWNTEKNRRRRCLCCRPDTGNTEPIRGEFHPRCLIDSRFLESNSKEITSIRKVLFNFQLRESLTGGVRIKGLCFAVCETFAWV